MLVPERDAVWEGDARAVVAAYPQPRLECFGRLELLHQSLVPQLVLRDRRRPQLDPEHLRRRCIRLQQHLPAAFVHLSDDLFLAQRREVDVARAANVVKQQMVIGRAAPRKERRAPQRAQRAHALGARVEGAKAGEVAQATEAIGELDVLESFLRVRDGDGGHGRMVDTAPANVRAKLVKDLARLGHHRSQHVLECMRGSGGDYSACHHCLRSVGRVKGGDILAVSPPLELRDRPAQPHLRVGRGRPSHRSTELRCDRIRQRGQPFAERARVPIVKLGPRGIGRVGLPLLGELDLALEPAVEDRAPLVPLDVVRVPFDARDLAEGRPHRKSLRVACVHTGDEGVHAAQEDFLAEDARHPLADVLVLPLGRRRVPDEGADSRADLTRP